MHVCVYLVHAVSSQVAECVSRLLAQLESLEIIETLPESLRLIFSRPSLTLWECELPRDVLDDTLLDLLLRSAPGLTHLTVRAAGSTACMHMCC